MGSFTAIELNGVLKGYDECRPEIRASDMKYFEGNRDLSHRIREPFDDELESANDTNAYLIVVRRHTWDALERRLFVMDDNLALDIGERTARVLWIAWGQYLYCGKTSSYVLSVIEQGFQDLENFPPVHSLEQLRGRYTSSLGCMYIAHPRRHPSETTWRFRWLQQTTKPLRPA